jgi:hypothetical protein
VTLNSNNNYGCGILGYQKAFGTIWHLGCLYKLTKLHFSTSLVESIISIPKEIQAGVPKGSILSPTL